MSAGPGDRARASIEQALAAQRDLLEAETLQPVLGAADLIAAALRDGRKLLCFGNGGSASEASHLSAELVGRFVDHRRALPAVSLNAEVSALTAIANDYGYEQVFARQVEALGAPGDVAVAFSTSGDSPNVLAGAAAARAQGLVTIGLTNADGGRLADAVDVCVRAPARSTARVQELHILIVHVWCELVEAQLF